MSTKRQRPKQTAHELPLSISIRMTPIEQAIGLLATLKFAAGGDSRHSGGIGELLQFINETYGQHLRTYDAGVAFMTQKVEDEKRLARARAQKYREAEDRDLST